MSGQWFKIFCLSAVLLAPGCGGGGGVSILPSTDEFAQYDEINPKMDILWVVDSSVSMRDEIENVINNINAFVSIYQEKNYNFRMGVIPTSAWSLEAYVEYAHWQECLLTAINPEEDCEDLKPQTTTYYTNDSGDRSYLLHPSDNKEIFSRLHTGECTNTSSGYKVIDINTPNLSEVFENNFNVFGSLDPENEFDENASHCGMNANLNPSHEGVNGRYVKFIHDYYYGNQIIKDDQNQVTRYRSTERGLLSRFVADERPLQSMRAFLNHGEDASLLLREDAFLAVILITDEPDNSTSEVLTPKSSGIVGPHDDPQVYIDFLTNLKGSSKLFKMYTIGRGNSENETGQLFNAAKLGKAAKLSGGLSLDITSDTTNYLDVLNQITGNIVEASTNFFLKCKPIPESITVEFFEPQGEDDFERIIVPEQHDEDDSGWAYSEEGQFIRFSEDYFPKTGTHTYVNYTPEVLGCNTRTGEIE